MSRTLFLPKPHVDAHNTLLRGDISLRDELCNSINIEQSVVFIGANGSGKTRLGVWLDLYSPHSSKAHRVSAQKSLEMPTSSSVISMSRAEARLLYGDQEPRWTGVDAKRFSRWDSNSAIHMLSDFGPLLDYLFSSKAEDNSKYADASRQHTERLQPPETKLLKLKQTWEALFSHRKLEIGSAEIHTKVSDTNTPYEAAQMSDGERVAFYLIGQCLAAPQDGVIVVDEPEIHLHKSIQAPLWAAIEALREDCVFVYITHDVDFAAAQVSAKKVWLKGFDGKSWDWEVIEPLTDFPEALLIEVLGSRKPVVFVEGENGSFDAQLYRAMLPDYLIVPRGSCSNVIEGVRALGRHQRFHHLKVFGIIDRDRRTEEEIKSLQNSNVFVLDVAEVENLFCVPEVLTLCSTRMAHSPKEILETASNIVFEKIASELTPQVSLRVAAEIKFRLNLFNDKANGEAALAQSLQQLVKEIDVHLLYQESAAIFTEVIEEKDYRAALRYYNCKSLASQIGAAALDLRDKALPQFVLRIAASAEVKQLRQALRPYFGAFAEHIKVA